MSLFDSQWAATKASLLAGDDLGQLPKHNRKTFVWIEENNRVDPLPFRNLRKINASNHVH